MENQNQQQPQTEFLKDFLEAIKPVIEKHRDNKNVGIIFGAVEKLGEKEDHSEAAAALGVHGDHKMLHVLAEGMKDHEEMGHFFGDNNAFNLSGNGDGLFEVLDKIFGVDREERKRPNIRPEDIN